MIQLSALSRLCGKKSCELTRILTTEARESTEGLRKLNNAYEYRSSELDCPEGYLFSDNRG